MNKKKTTETFIDQAINFHGEGRYNYSKTIYTGARDMIIIICNCCNLEFEQRASEHLRYGCKKCGRKEASRNQVKTTENFIQSAKKTHGEKYNYDNVEYVNAKTKVVILCVKCDSIFEQLPRKHIEGRGCPDCGKIQKAISNTKNIDYFVNNAKRIHGEKYNYDSFVYINATTKSNIHCCKCNQTFLQDAHGHIDKQAGCPACGYEATRKSHMFTLNQFIDKAILVHGYDYDYDNVVYTSSQDYVEIGCKRCKNSFLQVANAHLQGQGCRQCGKLKQGNNRLTQSEFINRCIEIHKDKYDYSDTIYTLSYEKVNITCRLCKRIFSQRGGDHLSGQGCPRCRFSKGEIEIEKYLIDYKINFKTQYKFIDCKFIRPLLFDFYIEKYNLIIEFDGLLHFEPLTHFGGEEALKIRQIRDNIKNEYCKSNGINLLRIKYNENIEEKIISVLISHEIFYKLLL